MSSELNLCKNASVIKASASSQDVRLDPLARFLQRASLTASCEHFVCLGTPDTTQRQHRAPTTSTHTYRLQIVKERRLELADGSTVVLRAAAPRCLALAQGVRSSREVKL